MLLNYSIFDKIVHRILNAVFNKEEVQALMFEHKVFKMDFAGRELSVEIGKIAELASGSAILQYGETMVMVNTSKSPTLAPHPIITFLSSKLSY